MDTLNNLKKIYNIILYLFLICIIFTSCSDSDNNLEIPINKTYEEVDGIYNKSEEYLSIERYASNHVEIIDQIVILMNEEDNYDTQILENISYNDEYYQLKSTLLSSGIKEHSNIADLFFQIKENTIKFIHSNPDLTILSSEEFNTLITTEIDNQFNKYHANSVGGTGDPCRDPYKESMNVCHRNFALSLGVSIGSGIVSGGVGWVYGGMTSLLIWIDCTDRAYHSLRDCLEG